MHRFRITIVLSVTIALLAGSIYVHWKLYPQYSSNILGTSSRPLPNKIVSPSPSIVSAVTGDYPQISMKNRNRDDAVREANLRREQDPDASGKTRLDFYGQVVDEHFHPVGGVTTSFNWRGGAPIRTFTRQSITDSNGRFSLTGEHGEAMVIQFKKAGYYIPKTIQQTAFEFFQPGNEEIGDNGRILYYQPDPDHPFVFQIRRKNENADVVKKTVEVLPPVDGTIAGFDFLAGELLPGGTGGGIKYTNVETSAPVLSFRLACHLEHS